VTTVYRRNNESFDRMYKRFKKAVQEDHILSGTRRRSYYSKPSELRKKKAAQKLAKSRKTTRKYG